MRLIVIGAGNWGTALASELSHSLPVVLWTRTPEHAREISESRQNQRYLPGFHLHEHLQVECAFASAVAEDDLLLIVVPSVSMSKLCEELKDKIHPGQIVINATKGLQADSLVTMGQMISLALPLAKLVTLTGPTIAKELAEGLPCRAVLSCEDVGVLLKLKKALRAPNLSFAMSRDVEGAELCAALKGLVAIACGIADGLGYKTNVQGALLTAGIREFGVLARFLQVPEKTIYGLSGLGDLFTTCISPDSRNRRFGRLLAQGKDLESALAEVGMVVEGVSMARTVKELAHFDLDIPFFSWVAQMIFEGSKDVKADLRMVLEGVV